MDLQRKLTIMSSVIIVPFVVIILFLLVMFGRYGDSYDGIVRNVTLVNDYNIRFKENMDSVMYQMVARSLSSGEVEEAIGMEDPERMIDEAEAGFSQLEISSTSPQASQVSSHVLKLLGTLRKHVGDISSTVKVSGSYEENMAKLDNDIRIITELIQERIAEYLSYETVSMEQVRQDMVASRISLIHAAVITLIVLIAVAIVFATLIMRSITRPIRQLCDASEQIGKGHFDTRINIAARNELSLLGSSFNHMSEQITVLIEDIRTEQIYNRNMELKLLQSQINPHFLYNTLDNIIWLSQADRKEDVASLVMSLSRFFRTTLSGGRDIIPLKEEISHVEAYLQIQQFRYRDILSYRIDLPEELMEVPVIKMTLQPLVENALYHGIKYKREMGEISITARKEGENACICVTDNGIGMKEEDLVHLRNLVAGTEKPAPDNSGFGIVNVAQRLKLNFGEEYGLTIESVYGEGTTITVHTPGSLPPESSPVIKD
jgi:two-component system sensor histidine kinase YesM